MEKEEKETKQKEEGLSADTLKSEDLEEVSGGLSVDDIAKKVGKTIEGVKKSLKAIGAFTGYE